MDLHVVSISGGKDSTCMLIRMLELGYTVDRILYVDTGIEHPKIRASIEDIEKLIDRELDIRFKLEQEYIERHLNCSMRNKTLKTIL